MGKSLTLILVFLIAAFYSRAWALAPPDQIEKWNLQADVIVYGQVKKTAADTNPYFVVDILHIIKGNTKVTINEKINIHYEAEPVSKSLPKGVVAQSQGISQVHVAAGDHVIAYLKKDEAGRYKPVLKGLSVIVVESLKSK